MVCTYHGRIIIPKNQIKNGTFSDPEITKYTKLYEARIQAIPPYHLVTPSLNTTRLGLQCQTPALGL